MSVLKLKRGEDRRIRFGHPWVFSNEVDTAATPLSAFEAGATVQVHSSRDEFLGHAYVNPHALISARILGRNPQQPIGPELLIQRLKGALTLRESLYSEPYYRLVFGESDGLPGLVLDRYGSVVVGQIATAGMEALRSQVEQALRTVVQPDALYWKDDSSARELEHLPAVAETAFGEVTDELSLRENGIDFRAPLRQGQKTGWFYDQAANRQRLMRYLPRGARVLDICSYVGAWAVSALRNGAGTAVCVDSSELALDFVKRNATLNEVQLETVCADAFEAMKQLRESGQRFDTVILDPPAFIKRKKDLPRGQAAYQKLNQLALALIENDGLLVSCSCSYHLPSDDLAVAIQSAARQAGRVVQILESGGQSPDHPVHPAIPETRYLKAFFCRVTRD